MKIEATYIGSDGSLGYIHGEVYELYVNNTFISRLNGTGGVCQYDTIHSFLSNWDNIKILL